MFLGLGKWTAPQANALTVPCYIVGAISYLLVARLSDHQQRRGMYQVIFASTSIVGYGILLSDARAGVKYFGCFVISLGLYITLGIPLAWLPTNQPRYGKRTTATGLQLTVGNCAGIMAPFVSLYFDTLNLQGLTSYVALPYRRRTPLHQGPCRHYCYGSLCSVHLWWHVVLLLSDQ